MYEHLISYDNSSIYHVFVEMPRYIATSPSIVDVGLSRTTYPASWKCTVPGPIDGNPHSYFSYSEKRVIWTPTYHKFIQPILEDVAFNPKNKGDNSSPLDFPLTNDFIRTGRVLAMAWLMEGTRPYEHGNPAAYLDRPITPFQ